MKRAFIWILSFILTLVVAYYQRVTGPTYPVKDSFEINGKQVEIVYVRSHTTGTEACVKFVVPDHSINGKIFMRMYPTNEPYVAVDLQRHGDTLIGYIKQLPPAGKMQYYITLYDKNGNVVYTRSKEPVIIRYKGDVPAYFLIPHILFMFLAIFLGLTAGLLALFDDLSFRKIQIWTLVSLIIGGFIFGPIVQKYAFGQLWTGIPFGWDLTDNKTLIAFTAWTIAAILNIKKQRPIAFLIATLVLYAIYTIPHSAYGSELNYETGKVTQGFILSLIGIF